MHKDSVLDLRWNANGNAFITASKDSLVRQGGVVGQLEDKICPFSPQQVKLFDIRMMKEVQTFRSHAKEVNCVAWHPVFDDVFASGGGDGDLYFWQVG